MCPCEDPCPHGGLGKCANHYCAWCCACGVCKQMDQEWQRSHPKPDAIADAKKGGG